MELAAAFISFFVLVFAWMALPAAKSTKEHAPGLSTARTAA